MEKAGSGGEAREIEGVLVEGRSRRAIEKTSLSIPNEIAERQGFLSSRVTCSARSFHKITSAAVWRRESWRQGSPATKPLQ